MSDGGRGAPPEQQDRADARVAPHRSSAPVTAAPLDVVRIGTRASELALRQARLVAAALEALGVATELVTYTTVGDRRLDEPLREIGAKGLFTHELEEDLRAGCVDCCVHSLKDLPTASPPEVPVIALLPREDPRDALVVRPHAGARSLADLPAGACVGTSSLRRRAQLLAARPDLHVAELRGNVPTRLRKLERGDVDAAILAAAGLHRLDLAERIDAYLEPPGWLPAAGQGAIAIQARAGDARLRALLAALDDAPTRRAVAAERALLAALDGGCQVPIGALATADERLGTAAPARTLRLYALVASMDGRRIVRGEIDVPAGGEAAAGEALAAALRAQGADDLLREARHAPDTPRPQPE